MARRISDKVDMSYRQSMLIARTEAHRVRETGLNDAANEVDDILKANYSDYRKIKIWNTLGDAAVRDTHSPMDNVVVLQDEKFELPSGATADCPATTGIASEDCNCRCFVTHDIVTDDEYYALTGEHLPDLKGERIKELENEAQDIKDEMAVYTAKTYSNIWKDDVTAADWYSKQGSISAKKTYFEDKLLTETNPLSKQKWENLLDDLADFDKQGKEYYKLKTELDNIQNETNRLKYNSAKMFTQEQKDAALWFDSAHGGFAAADKYFDPQSKLVHKAATAAEHDGFYTYTCGSGGHNRPLAGFEKPWTKSGTGWEAQYYKGAKNVWIDYEGKGDQIRGLITTLIEKSTYADDVWLQSGQDFATIEGIWGVPYGKLQRMTKAELKQLIGEERTIYQFLSTAVNEGGGVFNGKPMKLNIFVPKGSEMLYASDVGAFGKSECEMILQRGGTYKITDVYWGYDATDGNRKKLFVDMELHPEKGYDKFQQDPAEWTGSRINYKGQKNKKKVEKNDKS